MSQQLNDEVHAEVTESSARGNELLAEGQYQAAVSCFQQALDFLPKPIEQWEAASWLLGAIGDAYFLDGKSQSALKPLLAAMHCANGIGNPFLHLRLGQVQFDLGNEILGADELTRAYMGGGKELFDDEDPKYFALLKAVLIEPHDGW